MQTTFPQLGYPPATRARQIAEVVAPLDSPAAPSSSGLPAALSPEQGIYVRLSGANFPPAGSIPVDEPADGNLAPATTTTLLTYLVPSNLRLRVAGIGFGATDLLACAFLTWALFVDADPVSGYRSQPAAVGSLRNLSPIVLVVPADRRLNVVVTISANAVWTYRYECRIAGWLWQERMDR